MGLKMANGKQPGNADKMSDLKLKQGQKIMMLGSQEEAIMAANTLGEDGEEGTVEDFELEDEVFKELAPHNDPDVLVCNRPSPVYRSGTKLCTAAAFLPVLRYLTHTPTHMPNWYKS